MPKKEKSRKKKLAEEKPWNRRPKNYGSLSPREQWEIDKKLGILDWDGKEELAVSLLKEKYKGG